jgi:hypothetical protein
MITRRQKSAEEQRNMKGKGKGPDWVYRGWTERTAPPWAAGQTPHRTWYLDLSSSATASRLKTEEHLFLTKDSTKRDAICYRLQTLQKLLITIQWASTWSLYYTFFWVGFLISKQKWEFKRGEFFLPNCIWDCLNMVHLLDPIAVLPTSTNLGSQDVATWDLQNEHHEGRSWCCRRSLLWSLLSILHNAVTCVAEFSCSTTLNLQPRSTLWMLLESIKIWALPEIAGDLISFVSWSCR